MADAVDRDIDKFLKTLKTPMSPEKEKSFRAEQRRLLLDEQKHLKSAKRWESVAKNTERAEKVLDVAGLFTGGGALVGGAKMLGKKLLKKKLKKGSEDWKVPVKLKQPYGSKQKEIISDKELINFLKKNKNKIGKSQSLTSLGLRGAGGATVIEGVGDELGKITGLDIPDLNFATQLVSPRTAYAPSEDEIKNRVDKALNKK